MITFKSLHIRLLIVRRKCIINMWVVFIAIKIVKPQSSNALKSQLHSALTKQDKECNFHKCKKPKFRKCAYILALKIRENWTTWNLIIYIITSRVHLQETFLQVNNMKVQVSFNFYYPICQKWTKYVNQKLRYIFTLKEKLKQNCNIPTKQGVNIGRCNFSPKGQVKPALIKLAHFKLCNSSRTTHGKRKMSQLKRGSQTFQIHCSEASNSLTSLRTNWQSEIEDDSWKLLFKHCGQRNFKFR